MLDPALLDPALAAFITLFVVVDPIGLAPIFVATTSGATDRERRRIALSSLAIAAVILTVFGLAGETILEKIGIGLPAFRISGGIMLFLIALEMLFEKRNPRRTKTAEDSMGGALERDPTVFPLATPLIAGPGSMASMILLTAGAETTAEEAVVFGCMFAVLLLCLVLFLAAGLFERLLGPTGINVVTRLLGVLLGALAVQFVLDGLADFGFVANR
ncbi:MAG: MarC family protein [Pseudomonadota bacterium]